VTDRVLLDVRDEVAYVTLNRPDKYNGLDMAMFRALVDTAATVAADDSVRVAILSGAGKAAANKAELAALASGERKTWRGDDGSYGYVAPVAGGGDCRDFTHTVYINGRPQVGSGKACRAGESWKLS